MENTELLTLIQTQGWSLFESQLSKAQIQVLSQALDQAVTRCAAQMRGDMKYFRQRIGLI